MVDLTFVSRATHFVPLALLRWIADSDPESQKVVDYIGLNGIQAIKCASHSTDLEIPISL